MKCVFAENSLSEIWPNCQQIISNSTIRGSLFFSTSVLTLTRYSLRSSQIVQGWDLRGEIQRSDIVSSKVKLYICLLCLSVYYTLYYTVKPWIPRLYFCITENDICLTTEKTFAFQYKTQKTALAIFWILVQWKHSYTRLEILRTALNQVELIWTMSSVFENMQQCKNESQEKKRKTK